LLIKESSFLSQGLVQLSNDAVRSIFVDPGVAQVRLPLVCAAV